MSIAKLHWQALFLFCIVISMVTTWVADKYAFFYGVLIGLLNLVVAYGFLYWNQCRVSRWQGQSLIVVFQSVIVRAILVGGLLVYGFTQLRIDGVSIVIGFVLGQFYYLFTQLVGIIKHGK